MSFSNIQAGNKLDIRVQYRNMGEVVYASKVMDILDADTSMLAIYLPMRSGKVLGMLHGKEYDVTVYTDYAMIAFKGYFEGYVKDGGNYFVALRLSNEGYRIQRREFFRFSCNIPIRYSILDFDTEDEQAKILHDIGMAEVMEGTVKDIGGGGLRFMTESDLNLDHLVECTVILGDVSMIIKGKILEKQYTPKSILKYQYRLLFIDIPLSYQETIINFIFAEQRKQRQTSAAL